MYHFRPHLSLGRSGGLTIFVPFLGSPSFTDSSETLYDLDISLFHISARHIFMHFLRCLKSSVVPPGRRVQSTTCAMLVVDTFLSF
jgi:hypothetical protein